MGHEQRGEQSREPAGKTERRNADGFALEQRGEKQAAEPEDGQRSDVADRAPGFPTAQAAERHRGYGRES